MPINRVPLGGIANNQYHGQGQFCFYRKGSAASGLTDVAVYVDSAYMGLMSPSEHFKLNQTGKFWEFKPVDPALVGEFVLADTAEEYGTSLVAGNFTVSNFPAVQAVNAKTRRQAASDAGGYFTHSATSTLAAINYAFVAVINTSAKKVYIDKVGALISNAGSSGLVSIQKSSYTGTYSGPMTRLLNAGAGGTSIHSAAIIYAGSNTTDLDTQLSSAGITRGTPSSLVSDTAPDATERQIDIDGCVVLEAGEIFTIEVYSLNSSKWYRSIQWWEE